MKKSAPVGAIVGVVVVALVLVYFLYQHFMAGPAAMSSAQMNNVPSFIDPATNRPKTSMNGTSPTVPASGPGGMGRTGPGGGYPGPGANHS